MELIHYYGAVQCGDIRPQVATCWPIVSTIDIRTNIIESLTYLHPNNTAPTLLLIFIKQPPSAENTSYK